MLKTQGYSGRALKRAADNRTRSFTGGKGEAAIGCRSGLCGACTGGEPIPGGDKTALANSPRRDIEEPLPLKLPGGGELPGDEKWSGSRVFCWREE